MNLNTTYEFKMGKDYLVRCHFLSYKQATRILLILRRMRLDIVKLKRPFST